MSREASTRIDTLEKFDVWVQDFLAAWGISPNKLHLSNDLTHVQKLVEEGVTSENFWLVREQIRYLQEEYVPVNVGVIFPIEHFVHVSTNNPALIAYTANAEHGRRDRQTRLTLGRYLKKTFPDWSDDKIRVYSSTYSAKYGPVTLKFAETEDEFERVYLNGPSSCMAHPASSFDTPFHPVRVYAGHGLRLAYLETSEETIVARTLVWENSHSTIYGDKDKMQAALAAANIYARGINGALMQLRYTGDRIICPYIDEGYVSIEGNSLRISSDGEFNAQSTSGFTEQETICCDHCGDNYDTDDLRYSEYHDENLCRHCRNNYYTYATYTTNGAETWVLNDNVIEVDSEYYLDDSCVLAEYCNRLSDKFYDEEWTHEDTVDTHAGYTILVEDSIELHTGEIAHRNEDIVELHDGRMALEDDPAITELEDGTYALISECVLNDGDSYTLLPKGEQHEATA